MSPIQKKTLFIIVGTAGSVALAVFIAVLMQMLLFGVLLILALGVVVSIVIGGLGREI